MVLQIEGMSTPAVNAVLRVGERCEIALPPSIREELHISEGDLLSASVTEEGQLVLTPVAEDPWERLRRLIRPYFQGVDPIAYQRESRADDDAAPSSPQPIRRGATLAILAPWRFTPTEAFT